MNVAFSARGVRPPAGVEPLARRGLAAVLRHGGVKGRGELNVVWVTRRALRKMGVRFRNADRFTDVISFRYEGGSLPGEETPFGDLYISPEQAAVNARLYGVSAREECVRLAVHGGLHLLGYTDYDPVNKAEMWAVQEPIVRRLFAAKR
jgi:probable rRNA maturation factor